MTVSGEHGQGPGRFEDLPDGRNASAAACASPGSASHLAHRLGSGKRVSADGVVVYGAAVANEHGRRLGLGFCFVYQIENDIQYQPGPKNQKFVASRGLEAPEASAEPAEEAISRQPGGPSWRRRALERGCMPEPASRSWQTTAVSASTPPRRVLITKVSCRAGRDPK